MILSFDVGIKNLAYCVIDSNSGIHDWGVFRMCGEKNSKSVGLVDIGLYIKENITKLLNEYDITTVIIENQLASRAVRMKAIQGMLTQLCI